MHTQSGKEEGRAFLCSLSRVFIMAARRVQVGITSPNEFQIDFCVDASVSASASSRGNSDLNASQSDEPSDLSRRSRSGSGDLNTHN